ncbi:MAG: SusC/RagA family TonB-linked outer membrane protein [Marinilabiliaceae bacterium]|jgi:TonB-linked SusC/RagA family outer membrane protein|nr:SusC/RagA family TonB-linked outer membrane protein [Marinilabiliaceae bacterium]
MKKLMLFIVFFALVFFQAYGQRIITGKVTDPGGEPLPYLVVSVKGTTLVSTTDEGGNYSISVPENTRFLVFSFVGMQTQELEITGNVVNCVMQPKDLSVGEVVVTALGITRERKALGYNVQEVGSEELSRRGNSDLVNSLAGKVTGVQVRSTSSSAGASTYMTIRGAASLTGDNQPLFVIDGMPINTDQSYRGSSGQSGTYTSSRSIDLNPEDIATMTVLKGGAATALYGLQASNGVIVITTKKGAVNQKMRVSIHSSVGVKKLGRRIPIQNKYAQGINGDWRSKYDAAWGPLIDTCSYSLDPSDWANPLIDVDGAIVSMNDPNATGDPVKTYDQYDFFQTGINYNNNVSVEAGNENSSYFFSVGNLEEEGIIPTNTFGRTTIRLNADTRLSEKVKTGANVMYANTRNNLVREGGTSSGLLGLYRTPSTFDNAAGYKLPDGTQRTHRGANGSYNNPYWTAYEQSKLDKNNRFVGNTFLNWELTDWLSFSYNVGVDWFHRGYATIYNWNSVGYRDGSLTERREFHSNFNSDVMLIINKDLSDDIGFNLTIGQNMFQKSYNYLTASTQDLSLPTLYNVDNTSSQTASQGSSKYRTAALFADFSMDYKSMIYFGATIRNEWSTTMPDDNLDALFPSVSGSFVFTELEAFKDMDFLSFGKLRTSWAKTANIASPYRTTSYYGVAGPDDFYTSGISFPYLGYAGFTVGNTIGNADLRHEKQTSFEVGLELRFFMSRLGIDATYFNNENSDLLLSVPIAGPTGYSSAYLNAATMESKGIELSLNAVPLKIGGFVWEFTTNFTRMRNPVTGLAKDVEFVTLEGDTKAQINAAVGYDYPTIFGFDFYRDDDGNLLINDDPTDSHPDGFPWTDKTKTVALGKVNPDWTLNIYNTFSFKGFSLISLIDIKQGGYVNNGTRFRLDYHGLSEETLDRTTPTVFEGVLGHLDGDGNVVSTGVENTMEVIKDQGWYRGENGFSAGGAGRQAVEDASWVKLRELTLSYSFNQNVLEKLRLSKLELYVTGNNLLILSPYRGGDPEVSVYGASNGQGFDYFASPASYSYQFGIKLSF